MADIKEQLAAIRSLVPKAETSDANVSLLDKCLDRLPYFAHIEDFNNSRGFGFISTEKSKRDVFFHIK